MENTLSKKYILKPGSATVGIYFCGCSSNDSERRQKSFYNHNPRDIRNDSTLQKESEREMLMMMFKILSCQSPPDVFFLISHPKLPNPPTKFLLS